MHVESRRLITLFDYEACKGDELSFAEGEEIILLNNVDGGWWEGKKVSTGEVGWFPSNYVSPINQLDVPEASPADTDSERVQTLKRLFISEREFTHSFNLFYEVQIIDIHWQLTFFVDNSTVSGDSRCNYTSRGRSCRYIYGYERNSAVSCQLNGPSGSNFVR